MIRGHLLKVHHAYPDILNIVLPPREWGSGDNEYFMQYVSHERPEREDVERVQNRLEESLLQMQARSEGICPIREYLFSQVFDEIIRQVTINSPERGVMLMRVRDEAKMTIAAYQTVYQKGLEYDMEKMGKSEEGVGELEAGIGALEVRKEELVRRRMELLSKKKSIEMRNREKNTIEREKREY